MLLGVDVGGTFTDAVLYDGAALHTAKAPTTPGDQSRGVIAAVEEVLERAGAEPGDVEAFAHGMTVGTNALLDRARRPHGPRRDRRASPTCSRSPARTGRASTTSASRSRRRSSTPNCASAPPSGSGPDGVVEPLAEAEVDAPGRRAARLGRGVGRDLPALLLSRPGPRARARRAPARRAVPEVHVSASHEVLARFREYERCSTTVIDAYLSPFSAATSAGSP